MGVEEKPVAGQVKYLRIFIAQFIWLVNQSVIIVMSTSRCLCLSPSDFFYLCLSLSFDSSSTCLSMSFVRFLNGNAKNFKLPATSAAAFFVRPFRDAHKQFS